MNDSSRRWTLGALCVGTILGLWPLLPGQAVAANTTNSALIRTPSAPASPRINGPAIFGVRPGSPFLYRIPATGDRPMQFSVKGLPPALRVDSQTGDLTGSLAKPGEKVVNGNRTFKPSFYRSIKCGNCATQRSRNVAARSR